jgi:hypothetical protein
MQKYNNMSLESKYEAYLIDFKKATPKTLIDIAAEKFSASKYYVGQIVKGDRTPVKKKGLAVKQWLEEQLKDF